MIYGYGNHGLRSQRKIPVVTLIPTLEGVAEWVVRHVRVGHGPCPLGRLSTGIFLTDETGPYLCASGPGGPVVSAHPSLPRRGGTSGLSSS